jgi:hypothetical protein
MPEATATRRANRSHHDAVTALNDRCANHVSHNGAIVGTDIGERYEPILNDLSGGKFYFENEWRAACCVGT